MAHDARPGGGTDLGPGRPPRRRRIAVGAVTAMALTVLAGVATASPVAAVTTHTVCASGCDYTSVAAAVDASAGNETISVAAGTYHEHQITLAKPGISVIGAGAGLTIIDGDLASDLSAPGTVRLMGPATASSGGSGSRVRNLTIRNAGRTADPGAPRIAIAVAAQVPGGEFSPSIESVAITGVGLTGQPDRGISADGAGLDASTLQITATSISGTSDSAVVLHNWRTAYVDTSTIPGSHGYAIPLRITDSSFAQGTDGAPAITSLMDDGRTTGGWDAWFVQRNQFTGAALATSTAPGTLAPIGVLNLDNNHVTGLHGTDIAVSVSGLGSAPTGATVGFSSNTIDSSSPGTKGLVVVSAPTTPISRVNFADNRITGTGTALTTSGTSGVASTVAFVLDNDMAHNGVGWDQSSNLRSFTEETWWGCNSNPVGATAPCAPIVNTGTGPLTVTNWLAAVATSDVASMTSGGSTTLRTGFRLQTTSGTGAFTTDGSAFNGVPVTFATANGSTSPANAAFVATGDGSTGTGLGPTSTFTAGSGPATNPVTVTVDGIALTPAITISAPVPSTRTVCASGCRYSSIATAVNAATNGDTVSVAAGTYHEHQIRVAGKSITLSGAGAASTIIDGDLATDLTEAGTLRVVGGPTSGTTANLSANGFTIRNAGRTTGTGARRAAIAVQGAAPGNNSASFTNVTIVGTGATAGPDRGIWLQGVPGMTQDFFSLSGSTINGTSGSAVYLQNWRTSAGGLNARVQTSTLAGGTDGSAAIAAIIDDGDPAPAGSLTVTGTAFTRAGISVARANEDSSGGFDRLLIVSNQFTGLQGTDTAIDVHNAGSTTSGVWATLVSNTIVGPGAGSATRGIVTTGTPTGPIDNTVVANTSITGTGTAITVGGTYIGRKVAPLGDNRISGNGIGLDNEPSTATVSTDESWWGCNANPIGAAAPCNAITGAGTTQVNSWLVAVATSDAASVASNGTTTLRTGFKIQTSAGTGAFTTDGTAFDGVPVAFATTNGSVTPTTAAFVATGDGTGGTGLGPTASFTAANGPATNPVTVTVDGFPVTPAVTIAAPPPTGITGVIRDAVTHQPIAGLQVRSYPVGASGSSATTTDADGRYTFTLPVGQYDLWFRDVRLNQYVSEYYDEATTLATATPVTVTTAGRTTIDEELTPKAPPPVRGTIAGTITGPDGTTPVAGIQVRLYSATDGYASSAAATTDAAGHYAFANKLAGDYKLWFRDTTGTHFVSEYYADQPTIAAANVLTLAGASATADASLASIPPAPVKVAIVGHVTDPDGNPIAGLQVRLYTGPGYTSSAATTTDAAGAYQFTNRAQGTYKLWFRDLTGHWTSEYFEDATTLAAATEVVAGPEGAAIDATLSPKP